MLPSTGDREDGVSPDGRLSRKGGSVWLRVGLPITILAAGFALALGLSQALSRFARDRAVETVLDSTAPAPDAAVAALPQPESGAPLRLALAPVLSPESSLLRYQRLADYIAGRLGRQGRLLIQSGYAQTNELLREGRCDVALVCTYAFLRVRDAYGVQALVVPRVHGKTTYRSILIIAADNPAESLLDLAGRRFATADEMSTSGWLYPAVWLKERGRDPARFFSEVEVVGAHDLAVKAVAYGDADCAAVHSLVYEQMPRDVLERTRVLDESQEFGMPPFVVPANVPPEDRERLLDAFLTLDQTVTGREILVTLDIERFERPAPDLYRDVEDLVRRWEGTR
jgi:phosphonate transport system substrate-binding protein